MLSNPEHAVIRRLLEEEVTRVENLILSDAPTWVIDERVKFLNDLKQKFEEIKNERGHRTLKSNSAEG